MFGFPAFVDDIAEGRGVEGLLVLEFGREIDTVVFADVANGFRWKFVGVWANAEGFENVTSSREIAAEGVAVDACEFCKSALANEFMFVVEVYHRQNND